MPTCLGGENSDPAPLVLAQFFRPRLSTLLPSEPPKGDGVRILPFVRVLQRCTIQMFPDCTFDDVTRGNCEISVHA